MVWSGYNVQLCHCLVEGDDEVALEQSSYEILCTSSSQTNFIDEDNRSGHLKSCGSSLLEKQIRSMESGPECETDIATFHLTN